jgi:hypothetical protein
MTIVMPDMAATFTPMVYVICSCSRIRRILLLRYGLLHGERDQPQNKSADKVQGTEISSSERSRRPSRRIISYLRQR